jgi:ubiquinone/menaquinone biosynthesis C-methylase UbiE
VFDWLKKSKKESEGKASQARAHPMLEIAREQLAIREDDVVLHVGFGWDLELLIQLVPQLDKGRLAGIESNQAALDRAIRIFDEEFSTFKADFRNAVVSKMPFYDGSFTKVLSLDQMHTWVNVDKAFDEINRVLAPGGIFVLVWSQPADGDSQVQGRRIFGQEEVSKLLKDAGFYHPILRERVEGPLHYTLFTSRKL